MNDEFQLPEGTGAFDYSNIVCGNSWLLNNGAVMHFYADRNGGLFLAGRSGDLFRSFCISAQAARLLLSALLVLNRNETVPAASLKPVTAEQFGMMFGSIKPPPANSAADPMLWFMHDNHTFVKLRQAHARLALAHAMVLFDQDPYGMLCGKKRGTSESLPDYVHGHGKDAREQFESEARAFLTKYVTLPDDGLHELIGKIETCCNRLRMLDDRNAHLEILRTLVDTHLPKAMEILERANAS
jgi:hypothetical protein